MLQKGCEDVFREFPRFPPKRDIEFSIDFILGATQVSKTPYRMSAPKLKELNIHQEYLLKKGCIHPSVFPWGSLVLFVKNNYGTLRLYIEFK